jgi:uncharacterized membrane protein YsdA (DUF1294 family)/cold shock CspA family protein
LIRSHIVEWDHARGIGFAEAGGKRVFVHHREFLRKARPPRKGDLITFVLGEDGQGRVCAKAIESVGVAGAVRVRDVVVLLTLLVPPTLVVMNLPWSPWIPVGLIGVLSWLTWWSYGIDKALAGTSSRRVPERVLQSLAFFGGWPGAFLAQRHFRHKTAKASFQRGFWMIVLLHGAVAIDFLLGWPGLRSLLELATELITRLPS